MTTQTERIAALEEKVLALEVALAAAPKLIGDAVRAALNEELRPLAERVTEAHERINHAGRVFKSMRDALTPVNDALRIPTKEFGEALEDLRQQAKNEGRQQRYFSTPEIRERAAAIRAQA